MTGSKYFINKIRFNYKKANGTTKCSTWLKLYDLISNYNSYFEGKLVLVYVSMESVLWLIDLIP